MALIRTDPPETDPVTLAETKAHMHVDLDLEDARIADFIRTATNRLDGRDGLLGRCLITQSWKLMLDRFASEIAIPLPPCQSIDTITYIDPAGQVQVLAPSEYQAFALGTIEGAKVRPAYGKSWPTIRTVPEAVTITFTAGFGDDPEDVPEPLRTAIKMHVGHLFEHRESVMLGSGFITETPHAYEDLIRDYRVWSF